MIAAPDLRLAADRATGQAPPPPWPEPDLGVLRLHRRPPPPLPLEVFGERWGDWIVQAAEAAACPTDYVAAPLLSSAAMLIGHARWAQATPGWAEPPHLWVGAVGDSGNGKSPGADCLMRDVLPEIEQRLGTVETERPHAVEFRGRCRMTLTQRGPGAWGGAEASSNRACSDAQLDTIFHPARIGPEANTPRLGAFLGDAP